MEFRGCREASYLFFGPRSEGEIRVIRPCGECLGDVILDECPIVFFWYPANVVRQIFVRPLASWKKPLIIAEECSTHIVPNVLFHTLKDVCVCLENAEGE